MKTLLLFFGLGVGLAGIFSSCVDKDKNIVTEKRLSRKKALEDFDYYIRILKKAHPALYAFCKEERFNQLQDSLRSSISTDITLRGFYNLLNCINDKIACVHTNLYLSDKAREGLGHESVFFPYPTTLVEEHLLINATGYGLPEGTEILTIDGIRVSNVLDDLQVFQTADGLKNTARRSLAAQDMSFSYFMRHGPQRSFEVSYRRPEKDSMVRIKTIGAVDYKTITERNLDRYYYDPTDIDYDFYFNEEKGYALMTVRTFEYDTYSRGKAFEHFCENSFEVLRLKPGIKNLIIDIRENDGGNYSNCHQLFSWLTDKPFAKFARVSTRVKQLPQTDLLSETYSGRAEERVERLMKEEFVSNGSGRYMLSDSVNSPVEPVSAGFRGKVFVITNSEVSSAAAYFASLVQNTGRGFVVGEESRGGGYMHNGFINVVYELPYTKISFSFSIANVVHTYGRREYLGRGVIPDIVKPTTQADFVKNNDTQLIFIIDSLLN